MPVDFVFGTTAGTSSTTIHSVLSLTTVQNVASVPDALTVSFIALLGGGALFAGVFAPTVRRKRSTS